LWALRRTTRNTRIAPICVFGRSGGVTGLHRTRRRDGIDGVVLAATATQLPVRAAHLEHLDTLAAQIARQADTPRPGPFDPHRAERAVAASPGEQLAITRRGGHEAGDVDHAAEMIQHRGDVHLAVRINTHRDPSR
jgi:hypothetical protein